ncbi:MAG: hypothetical protein WB761_35445 [Solirubrobacteraceae bacterium]
MTYDRGSLRLSSSVDARRRLNTEISEIEKETAMAVKQKVTVSVQPTARRPSSAERRAAQIATVSTEQAELKREAAERRAKRAMNSNAPAASMPRKSATARRRNAR